MAVLDELKLFAHALVDAIGFTDPRAQQLHELADAIGAGVEEVHKVREEESAPAEGPGLAAEPIPAPPAPEPAPAPLPEPGPPPAPFGTESAPGG
jgi:hypothetical protein